MKIIFNCAYFSFHRQYCENIKKKLEKQGYVAIITESQDSCNFNATDIENKYIIEHNDVILLYYQMKRVKLLEEKVYINHAITRITRKS